MFFIVLPSSCVDGAASVVKSPLSVSLTVKEIPHVLVALEILGDVCSLYDPDVSAKTMLVN